jgi:HD-GYP domain-containing protein (c-di-GMP phosphodiesterase class II)
MWFERAMLKIQAELNRDIPLEKKLALIHGELKTRFEFVDRIGVSFYDQKSDLLRTYTHGDSGCLVAAGAALKLAAAPLLQEIAREGTPRVLDEQAGRGNAVPALWLLSGEMRSALAVPIYFNRSFLGFVYLASATGSLPASAVSSLALFGQMASSAVIGETVPVRTMNAALRTLLNMTRHKDEETASHLDRMSHYSHIIASALADECGFDDSFVEAMRMFSPMHDIGKITIPDHILLKPGKLSPDEFEIVKTHTTKGREIIDAMVADFEFGNLRHIDTLRNIVEFHHEALDGSGYPNRLRGDAIPMEARIVAVADIFDALTSSRPYKQRWNNQDAFETLRRLAGRTLDRRCVLALMENIPEVEQVQTRFAETG